MLPDTKEKLTMFIRMRDYMVQAKTITSILEMCGDFSPQEFPAALEVRLQQIAAQMESLSADIKGDKATDEQPVQDDSGAERPHSSD